LALSISDKCCSFELSIHQKILGKKCTQLLSILIMIIIVSWAANHQIKMISEGSCNIADWTNDAENSALHHSTKLLFKLYLNRKLFFFYCNISQYYFIVVF